MEELQYKQAQGPRIYVGESADQWLRENKFLSVAEIHAIVRLAYGAKAACMATGTSYPATYGGLRAYGEAVNSLRLELQNRLGWQPRRFNNFELTVSPDQTMGAAFVKASKATGYQHQTPSTRAGKQLLLAFARTNALQLNLPFVEHEPPDEFRLKESLFKGTFTVYFLMHFDRGSEVGLELARPIGPSRPNGPIDRFYERVIFPPMVKKIATSEDTRSSDFHFDVPAKPPVDGGAG